MALFVINSSITDIKFYQDRVMNSFLNKVLILLSKLLFSMDFLDENGRAMLKMNKTNKVVSFFAKNILQSFN